MDKIRDISPPPAASAASPPAFISKIDVPNNIASDEMNPIRQPFQHPPPRRASSLKEFCGSSSAGHHQRPHLGLNDQGQIPFGQSNLVIAVSPSSLNPSASGKWIPPGAGTRPAAN